MAHSTGKHLTKCSRKSYKHTKERLARSSLSHFRDLVDALQEFSLVELTAMAKQEQPNGVDPHAR